MDVTDFGCRIVKICMPDRDGVIDDVVVGYGDLEMFEKGDRFFGPVIGRFGNRINHASFTLDGTKYDVVANENLAGEPVQCHGGFKGFDQFVWSGQIVREDRRQGVRFYRLSPDGEEGFPGNMEAYVTYWLSDDNVVTLEYEATTDKPTVVNLSNHTYFNMSGSEPSYVMEHIMQVEADTCVQNNLQYCPDILLPVEDTPFDFREPHAIGERIDVENEQLKNGLGYDHNWVLDRKTADELEFAASVWEPASGRYMEVWTDQPAIQFYGGNFFDGTTVGKYGRTLNYRESIALETQKYPDTPHHAHFPSTLLNPGEKYTHMCEYRFGVK